MIPPTLYFGQGKTIETGEKIKGGREHRGFYASETLVLNTMMGSPCHYTSRNDP